MDQVRIISEGLTPEEAVSLQQDHSRSAIAIDGLNFIWRNLWFIIGTALACSVLSYLVVSALPRYYLATNTVVLERRDTRPFETDEQLKSQDRDRSAAETEMDFITSRQVIGRVVDKLQLTENPAFNPALVPGGNTAPGILPIIGKYVTNTYSYIAEQVGIEEPVAEVPDDGETEGRARDSVISTLIGQTSVNRGGESLAVRISVFNVSPKMAAKLANTVANEYVLASMEVKRQYSKKAAEYLKERGAQPFLTALRNEEVKLQQNRAELAAQFGENHPQIQAIEARIDTVNSIISAEMGRITEDLNNEAERPSARVVSQAEVPTKPYYPRTNVIVSSVFLASGILSIIGLLVVEGMRSTVRSAEQVIRMLRLPNLAYVPKLKHRRLGSGLVALKETIKSPRSEFSESMRSLYLGCRMTNSIKPRQVIMVTSCMPGDGKSTISLGLAATAAADGRRTALVYMGPKDEHASRSGDLPRPVFSPDSFFEGLSDVKSIGSSIPDLPELYVFELEERSFGPSSMLTSDGLARLVQELRKEFDFVVFDAPPLLSVDDANWLAPLIDGVILTLAWGRTTESELWEAASSLRLNQSPLFGTVINRLEPAKQARFGLTGAFKYSKKAKSLYRV